MGARSLSKFKAQRVPRSRVLKTREHIVSGTWTCSPRVRIAASGHLHASAHAADADVDADARSMGTQRWCLADANSQIPRMRPLAVPKGGHARCCLGVGAGSPPPATHPAQKWPWPWCMSIALGSPLIAACVAARPRQYTATAGRGRDPRRNLGAIGIAGIPRRRAGAVL